MKRVSFLLLTTGVGFLTIFMLTAVLRQNNTGTLLAEDGAAAYALIDIGTLGGPSSGAVDINNAGQAVGSSTISAEEESAAFLWQEGSVTPLTVNGSQTTHAFAINDMGQIAGTGLMDGHERAYILQPLHPFIRFFLPIVAIPEPMPSGGKDMAWWAGAARVTVLATSASFTRPALVLIQRVRLFPA